jgi:hypothetical protein
MARLPRKRRLLLVGLLGLSGLFWHSASWSFDPAIPASEPRRALPRPEPLPPDLGARVAARTLAAAIAAPGATSTYLSDLPWISATSGLLALADQATPRRDLAFPRQTPLVMAGQPYAKGFGTLPLSEIEYAIPPDAVALHAVVGLNDLPAIDGGSVEFHVFGDGVELYASGVVRRGESPRAVDVGLVGVKRLRLVVSDAGDGDTGDYANWADVALLRDPQGATASGGLADALAAAETARRDAVASEESQLHGLAAAELAVAGRVLDAAAPGPGTGRSGRPTLTVDGVRAAWDDERRLIVLANDALLLTFGLGGGDHGYLSVVDRRGGRLLFYDTTAAVRVAPGVIWSVHGDTAPEEGEPYRLLPLSDPVLGPGLQLELPLRLTREPGHLVARLALFAGQSYFTYQLAAEGLRPGRTIESFAYFAEGAPGGFVVGDHGGYLADRSRLWGGPIPDDGFERRATLEGTKPLLLWTGPDHALMATLLECVDAPATVGFRRELGRAVTALELGYDDALGDRPSASPRLLVEALPSGDLRRAGTTYRRIMDALYPPLAAPAWLRHQLGSWYVFGPGVDEARLRQQIDYIAEYLNDVGPWHVVIDAGWHVAYGEADAEFRAVDYDKFPQGIRSLVDYAHARGVRVVLYLPTGYVHDGRGDGEWLALPQLVAAHPEWLTPVYTHGDVGRFVLDYRRPDVQAHVERTLNEALVAFDADGISMDGLADAEGQLIPLPLRQTWRGAAPIQRASEIYALFARLIQARKPDAYVETGWMTPTCARPHATTFRYADELNVYDSPYPFGGFETHLDYAIVQKLVFGQRANMGANFGDPNRADALTWLRGAMALGVQATLSFDLTTMRPETAARYRAHLAHYVPFAGETRFDAAILPTSFATQRGPLVYLGVVNRDPAPRTHAVSLATLGLDGDAAYTLYEPEREAFRQVVGSFDVPFDGKGFRFFVLRREPGVLWTPSSFEERAEPGSAAVRVGGPASTPGVLWLASPIPTAVLLDGAPLSPRDNPAASVPGYRYDPRTGTLEVHYTHDAPHEVVVRWE